MKSSEHKKRLRDALMSQLIAIGADIEHYIDIVEDYLQFWDIKRKLQSDIRKRGVSYRDVSSTGVEMYKNNPSVKELVMVNTRMMAILKDLKLTTDNVASDGDEDDL